MARQLRRWWAAPPRIFSPRIPLGLGRRLGSVTISRGASKSTLVSIIEADGRDAGGLWLESSADLIYIADLQVLPELQGRGIGTSVLEGLIAQAAARGVPVELSVLQVNPRARSLYERLGFRVMDEGNPFIRMRHDSRAIGAV